MQNSQTSTHQSQNDKADFQPLILLLFSFFSDSKEAFNFEYKLSFHVILFLLIIFFFFSSAVSETSSLSNNLISFSISFFQYYAHQSYVQLVAFDLIGDYDFNFSLI